MSERSSQRLIDDLAVQLAPVRRVPRLGASLCGVVALWLVSLALAGQGASPGLAREGLASPGFTGVLIGLAVCGFGCAAAGLAAAVPGREGALAMGRSLGLLGLAIALGWGTIALLGSSAVRSAPAALAARCFGGAVFLGVLPGVALAVNMVRGWVGRPFGAAPLALAGAFGFGGLAIHLLCPVFDPRHVLAGHVSVPILMAAVGALPVSMLLRRYAR